MTNQKSHYTANIRSHEGAVRFFPHVCSRWSCACSERIVNRRLWLLRGAEVTTTLTTKWGTSYSSCQARLSFNLHTITVPKACLFNVFLRNVRFLQTFTNPQLSPCMTADELPFQIESVSVYTC